MALGDRIFELRQNENLTQEAMAQRLGVTRQAVSRWECGDTEPGVDTLRLIAREFGVPIAHILDLPEGRWCQSCGMPLVNEELLGTEADGAPSLDFCKYCYQDGAYTAPNITMEEMVEICVEHMVFPGSGFTEEQARSQMTELMPRLDRWSQE